MVKLSRKEIDILRFIRTSRHKTTLREVARGVSLPQKEVETFIQGMVREKLLNIAPGDSHSEDAYYTNPARREEIYELIG